MNGVHDMGGMHGFGPIVREANEPLFHAAWEARVFGIEELSDDFFNIDAFRLWNRAHGAGALSTGAVLRTLARYH